MALSRPTSTGLNAQGDRYALILLAPTLLLVLCFVALPVLYAGVMSFFKWNGSAAPMFIGVSNFVRLTIDGIFWSALGRNIAIAVSALVLQVFIALVIAYCLVRIVGRVGRLMLFFYLVPVIVSEICIGLIWRFIYNPYFGLLNGGLKLIGLGHLAQGWLGDPGTAFPAIIVVMSFTYLGLYVLLFVAAIRNVPESFYEAAEIDGAGHFHAFFTITLPMVWDAVRANALLCIVSSLKTFSLIFVLTNGGPDHASEIVSTYLYKVGFNGFEMGYASTIGSVQMVLTAIGAWIVFHFLRRSRGNAYEA